MTRLAITFLIGIPILWMCWFGYLMALWCARGWYWIFKGVRT